jgi:hypothetical protein
MPVGCARARVAHCAPSAGMQWQVTVPILHLYNTYTFH